LLLEGRRTDIVGLLPDESLDRRRGVGRAIMTSGDDSSSAVRNTSGLF
jgi:hypothetical protein